MILDDNAEAYWRLETATPNADERSRRTLTSTGGVVQGGGLILDGGTSRYFAGAQYADASVLGSRYQYNGFSMEACPTKFSPGDLVINHPGGQTTIFTCIHD